MTGIENKLEAVLFFKGEPESKKHLCKILNVSPEELEGAAQHLSASLAHRGIRLLILEDKLELVTAPEASDVVTAMRKAEIVRDLGKAGSETLSIVLYRGPATRAEIDFVRGVNSSFVVRNLLIRGLIERVRNPKNARSYVYQPTVELLKHLGVMNVKELPAYEETRQKLRSFEEEARGESETTSPETTEHGVSSVKQI